MYWPYESIPRDKYEYFCLKIDECETITTDKDTSNMDVINFLEEQESWNKENKVISLITFLYVIGLIVSALTNPNIGVLLTFIFLAIIITYSATHYKTITSKSNNISRQN